MFYFSFSKDLNDIADKYSGLKNNTILTLGGITDTSFVEVNSYNITILITSSLVFKN